MAGRHRRPSSRIAAGLLTTGALASLSAATTAVVLILDTIDAAVEQTDRLRTQLRKGDERTGADLDRLRELVKRPGPRPVIVAPSPRPLPRPTPGPRPRPVPASTPDPSPCLPAPLAALCDLGGDMQETVHSPANEPGTVPDATIGIPGGPEPLPDDDAAEVETVEDDDEDEPEPAGE